MSAETTTQLPALHEAGDITLNRGAVILSNAPDVSTQNLAGKENPPTLTVDHGKIQLIQT